MARIDEAIINFDLYEDAVEYLGMAEVTLPNITSLTQEISGAGLAGNEESVIIGHLAAMSMTLNFRTVTQAAINLLEPRIHKIDLRVAQQSQNTRTNMINIDTVKHIVRIMPKGFAPGKAVIAGTGDVSGEYSVKSYAMFMSGTKKIEVDPVKFIYFVNGKDYLKDVRRALGKS